MKNYYIYLDSILASVSASLSEALSEQEASVLRQKISNLRAQIKRQISSLELT